MLDEMVDCETDVRVEMVRDGDEKVKKLIKFLFHHYHQLFSFYHPIRPRETRWEFDNSLMSFTITSLQSIPSGKYQMMRWL